MVGTRSKEPAMLEPPSTPTRKRPNAAGPEEPSTVTKKAKPRALLADEVSVVAVAPAGKSNPKFKPRKITKCAVKTPMVEGKVPKGASILIIQRPWIDLLLDGHKTLEIRGQACTSKVGKRIYLALSGGGGIILGSVYFKACHGPFDKAEWLARAEQHCVDGDKLPYGGRTHAWEFVEPQRFRAPVPYLVKPGVVVWAIKD